MVNFPGHSVPLTALGAFILILGFLAFNGGSQGSITEEGDADTVALAIVNTILGQSHGDTLTLCFSHLTIVWCYRCCGWRTVRDVPAQQVFQSLEFPDDSQRFPGRDGVPLCRL